MHNFNSYMEVNLDHLCANVDYLKASAGDTCEIIPVLKGNAYGHGLLAVADALVKRLKIKTIAVAQVCEAETLRQGGFGGEVMLLAGMPPALAAEAVAERLIVPVASMPSVQLLSAETRAQGKKIYAGSDRCRIRGLKRFGVTPEMILKRCWTASNKRAIFSSRGSIRISRMRKTLKAVLRMNSSNGSQGRSRRLIFPASSRKSFTRQTARPASGFRKLFSMPSASAGVSTWTTARKLRQGRTPRVCRLKKSLPSAPKSWL